jgi:hypothetical protein
MSHLLPPPGHKAREMFDVSDLVAVSTGERPIPCAIWQARKSALATLERNPAVRRVVLFCADASNDQLRLVSVGRRGGHKVEWTFGPMTRQTRLL